MKPGSSKDNPTAFLSNEEAQLLIELAKREGSKEFCGVWAKVSKEELFCFVCGQSFKKGTQYLWLKDFCGDVYYGLIDVGTVEHGRSHIEKLAAFL